MKNPNGPSREDVECMQQEREDQAQLPTPSCVICGVKAVTTAAHIPVCQQHWEAYDAEAKSYPQARPFYDLLQAEYEAREKDRRICGMSKAAFYRNAKLAEPYGDPNYFTDQVKGKPKHCVMIDNATGVDQTVAVMRQHGMEIDRIKLKKLHAVLDNELPGGFPNVEKYAAPYFQPLLPPRTRDEVKAMERAIRPQMAALADAMHCCVNGYVAAQVAWAILGFSVPHNRSKKRLRRLKHSMTVLTLQTMAIKT